MVATLTILSIASKRPEIVPIKSDTVAENSSLERKEAAKRPEEDKESEWGQPSEERVVICPARDIVSKKVLTISTAAERDEQCHL